MQKLYLSLLVLSISISFSYSQVVVTSGTFPAMCQTSTGGAYVTQSSNIIIAETLPSDFTTHALQVNYVIDLPSGYSFNPGIGNVVFKGGDIQSTSFSIVSSQLTINYQCHSTLTIDTIIVSGLQINASTSAASPLNILLSASTNTTQNGNTPADAKTQMILNSHSSSASFIWTPSNTVCSNAGSITLNATPTGGVFSGPGVTGNQFDPVTAGIGLHSLYYADPAGCYNVSSNVTVYPIVGLTSDKTSICAGDTVKFTAANYGGANNFEFFVNGTSVQGPSTNSIYKTTTLTNGAVVTVKGSLNAGCFTISSGITISVNPKPTVNFSISNYCAGGTPTTFTSSVSIPPLGGSLLSVQWYFDVSSYVANANTTSHLFANAGNHSARMIVSLSTGCNVTKDSVFFMGAIPSASFTWHNTCGTNTVDFTNTSTILPISTITGYAWDFSNTGTTNSTSINPSYTYPSDTTYYARLTVTSDKGCKDDTLTRVYTLPGFTPTVSNPYIADFTTSPHGWNYDGSNSSWDWGIAPTAFGHGTKKIWSTGHSGTNTYNTDERSYLYGPCVNLASLDKPMIALRLSSVMNGKPAGTILEVTTDEGLNWEKLGTIGIGQNWYNEIGIVSTPSSKLANTINNNPTAEGWTNNLPLELSRLSLQKYAGQTSVRFRLNFASVSDVNAIKYAGFALDSVFIGNRNKMVLIEHFTNTPEAAAPCCNSANNIVDNLRKNRSSDVILVNYHTSFPGTDNYNLKNTADPSARALYYGVSGPPISFFNGITSSDNYTSNTSGILIDTNLIDQKSLDRSMFKIDLSTQINSNSNTLNAQTRITYINKPRLSAIPLIVNFIVVEDTAVDGSLTKNAVVRKMLPDAGGSYISQLWNTNDAATFSQSWSSSLISPGKKIGIIVMLQNNTTREVYQTAYLKGSGDYGTHVVMSTLETAALNEQNFKIYPNPANDEVNVLYINDSDSDYNWQLFDNLGKEIYPIVKNKGKNGFTFSVSEINGGNYFLKLSNEKGVLNKRIVVVR